MGHSSSNLRPNVLQLRNYTWDDADCISCSWLNDEHYLTTHDVLPDDSYLYEALWQRFRNWDFNLNHVNVLACFLSSVECCATYLVRTRYPTRTRRAHDYLIINQIKKSWLTISQDFFDLFFSYSPQKSRAIFWPCLILAHCWSWESWLPLSQEANPHWCDR